MFRRILVAVDSSEAAKSAFVFVTEWARSFDAEVWFIQLVEESHERRGGVVTDFKQGGRRTANTFSVSGATQRARTRQLVGTIAEAADTFRADLLVVGLDRRRMTQGFSRPLRDQLYEATNIPVVVAPRPAGSRVPAAPAAPAASPLAPTTGVPAAPGMYGPIALGPSPQVSVTGATRVAAHV